MAVLGDTTVTKLNSVGSITQNGTAVSLSNHTHTQQQVTTSLGLGTVNLNNGWGTVKPANSYTIRWGQDNPSGGGWIIGEKSAQTSMQIDGSFYQNEGSDKVLGSSELEGILDTLISKY